MRQHRRARAIIGLLFFFLHGLAQGTAYEITAQTIPRGGAPRTVIIDADTANEIDDLYAIVRALRTPQWRVAGLSSAQWNHRLSPPDTVLRSQALNEDLLRLMKRQEVPAPMGSEMIMGKPWGGTEPSDSPAAQLIIRTARSMPVDQKLTVVSLGAATNVASAIRMAPDILPRVSCYLLSGKFYADRQVWDKDEFNLRNDLNAANFLFDAEGLELHVMPINILYDFKFDQEDTVGRLAGRSAVEGYLAARWLSQDPKSKERVMWDLALVEAMARPESAREAEFTTPPENKARKIFVYTAIEVETMRSDFWGVVDQIRK